MLGLKYFRMYITGLHEHGTTGAEQWHADSTGVDAKLHHLGSAGAGLCLLVRSSECRHRRLVAE